MLGKMVLDPYGIESEIKESEGLGLLDIVTVIEREKITTQSEIRLESVPYTLKGYEIHMGRTKSIGKNAVPFSRVVKRGEIECNEIDGYISIDHKVWGTYLHGIFDNEDFLKELMSSLYRKKGLKDSIAIKSLKSIKTQQYDELARIVKNSLDMESIYRIMGVR